MIFQVKTATISFCLVFVFPYVLTHRANVCDSVYSYSNKNSNHCWYNPFIFETTKNVLLGHGFTVEEYLVHTIDGYILTIYRIPHNRETEVIGKPIFLQHGAISSSDYFVLQGEKSLAFILSNMGFDVWLGNSRSNYISKNHELLSRKDSTYWNFTLEEMGKYDLPVVIDKIAAVTQKPGEIIYIGDHINNLPIFGIDFTLDIINYLGENGYNYVGLPQQRVFSNICSSTAFSIGLCINLLDLLFGPSEEYPAEQYPIIFSLSRQTQSLSPLRHFIQMSRTSNFAPYDFGFEENMRKYGMAYPPNYEFGRIKLPVFLFSAENDVLAPIHNVLRLYNELKASSNYPVYHKVITGPNGYKYNPANFIYSNDLEDSLVKPLIEYLEYTQ